MEWYLKVVRDNYANFKGRAQRKEYWMFVLLSMVIFMAISVLENVMDLTTGSKAGILSSIYVLGILLPTLALAVRRLHDTNHSGWWLLIGLVPIIGGLILLYFYVIDGTPGSNKFGSDPKVTQTPKNTPNPGGALQ